MNNFEQVDTYINELKNQGKSTGEIIWELALACVGWPYVFGAAGALCTPANRKKRASAEHPTIVSRCQVLNGKQDSCSGCKWYPGGVNVRQFDCRGFTRWTAAQVGITIQGAGATSQWDNNQNWIRKGNIDTMPVDQLVCVFVRKKTKMEHTGWGLNGETIECSNGVQHAAKMDKKWTHWAIPKGLEGVTPLPNVPTLRRGCKGPEVAALQTDLMERGYPLPRYGADGDFGRETEEALKLFQADNGLTADGIRGPLTWAALQTPQQDAQPTLYTVTIPHLTDQDAKSLLDQFPAGRMQKEG